MAHFIGNAPASFAYDGGFTPAHRKDGDKKDAQVMIDSLEIGLGFPAQRTQPWIAINRFDSRMNSRNENHGMRSNWSSTLSRSFNGRSVTI
jgi:hypothetical protein